MLVTNGFFSLMHALYHLLALALLFQQSELERIRMFFGRNFAETVQLLKNQTATEPLPEKLSSDTFALPVGPNGSTALFGAPAPGRLIAVQTNIVFCPVTERVMALQALTAAPVNIQEVFKPPDSLKFDTHRPALQYRLSGVSYTDDGHWKLEAGEEPVSVWNIDNIEIVFQPITTSPEIHGQIWFVDKIVSNECASKAK